MAGSLIESASFFFIFRLSGGEDERLDECRQAPERRPRPPPDPDEELEEGEEPGSPPPLPRTAANDRRQDPNGREGGSAGS